MPQELEFDEFRIRFEPPCLWRTGEVVPLTPREFATLRALVEAGGDPVPAEDLIAKIWNGANYLDRSNLRHQILSLRQKLDKGPDYIVSARGAGYRLAATVVPYCPAPKEGSAESQPSLEAAPGTPAQEFAQRRFRTVGLGAFAAAIGLTVLALITWRVWPTEMQLLACRQLTRDGRPKDSLTISDGSRVYFTEYLGNKRIIASVPIHGGNVTALDLPLASPNLLALSPDRQSLLLFDNSAQQLYELQLSSSTLRPFPMPLSFAAGSGIGSAAWDPTGRRLAIGTSDGGVMVFEPGNAGAPLRLRFPGPLLLSGWSRLGPRLRLSVLDEKSDTNQWWEVTGSERTPRPLRRLSQNPNERVGAFTGDGRFFAFEAGDRNQAQIWIQDEQTHPPKCYPLTVDGRIWEYPQTVPGSDTILAAARQAQGQLVALPVSGREGVVQFTPLGISAYELEYSRDGQWIAYTLYPEHTIWRCRLDGSDPRQLTPAGMAAHQPHWSPDGTRIAFMGRERDSHSRIYLVPSSGGALDEPLPRGDDQGVPTWSGDGRSLIFGDLTMPAGFERAAVHVLDLGTSTVSTIAAPVGLWSPRMSPDGNYLAAVSYDNKSLYVRGKGAWRKCVTMRFVAEPIWSRDSSAIQFVAIAHAGEGQAIFRVSPAGEQPKLTTDLSPYRFTGAAWFGIGLDNSPLALLRMPEEIYALDWTLRRRIP